MLYKIDGRKKGGLYEFQKYRTLRVFGLTILNVTISIENAINDHVYQKDAINSFKESARPNLQEKVKKELTLKNTNKLLKRRHWNINWFNSEIFPLRTINVVAYNDYDDHFICDHEMYPSGALTPRNSAI